MHAKNSKGFIHHFHRDEVLVLRTANYLANWWGQLRYAVPSLAGEFPAFCVEGGNPVSSNDVSLQQRPAEGTITDEGVARLREMYGVKLRPEGPYLQDATPDTLTNFCNGIGDLNPLYRDIQHGRYTRWGSQLGHPCFPYAFGWPGRTRWGLSGVHGFYAGNDWEF